jgi:hypothetical protein
MGSEMETEMKMGREIEMGRKMETEMETKSKMEMERREMDGEQQFVAPIRHVSVYEVRVG